MATLRRINVMQVNSFSSHVDASHCTTPAQESWTCIWAACGIAVPLKQWCAQRQNTFCWPLVFLLFSSTLFSRQKTLMTHQCRAMVIWRLTQMKPPGIRHDGEGHYSERVKLKWELFAFPASKQLVEKPLSTDNSILLRSVNDT